MKMLSGLAVGAILISSMSIFASLSNEYEVKSSPLLQKASSKQLRMPSVGEALYQDGIYIKSEVYVTTGVYNGTSVPVPKGANITGAKAGIIQGKSSNYSAKVTSGTGTAKLLQNPLQSQTADNTWYYKY